MFEAERQAYLKALGIVQYVPREPVAGAMESPLLTEAELFPPQQDLAAESSAPLSQQPPAVVPAEPSIDSTASAMDPGALSAEGVTVNIPQELLGDGSADSGHKTDAVHKKMADADKVEFCFALLQTPSGIAVLAELGDAGVKDMSAQEHRLMGDILGALQIPTEQCRHQYFKWPLVNNPKIKQGWAEAQETLVAYLNEKLGDAGVSTLVVLGDEPVRALQIDNHQLSLTAGTLVTVHTPALQGMLSDWRAKARAWRMLAPLRGRTV